MPDAEGGARSPSPHIERPTAEGAAAWELVQMLEILRRGGELVNDTLGTAATLTGLATGDVDAVQRDGLRLSLTDVRQVVDAGLELMELGERVGGLAERLTPQPLTVGFEDVERAAAYDIAQGIMDFERLRWTSGLVDWRLGWAALAEGLRQEGADASWAGINLRVVLGAFRNASLDRIQAVATSAALDPNACPAQCSPKEIARLVTSLLDTTRG